MTRLTLARTGRPLRLGEKLAGGGEATIFACPDLPDYVAKVYAAPPDAAKVAKLRGMAEAGQPALTRITAWPVELICDERKTARGFTMPRVAARRNVHELYSPKSRAQVFPEADFRFLTHVTANVARAFAVVHGHGHVIGDVNHGNLLVSPNGTVTLIDCDSFQFRDNGKVYTCDVGETLFTPPELQHADLKGLVRTPNHDAFGLAVLLFHLLFMGRHPFAGRYLGAGEMPIERAIAEYRFAYGPNQALALMERPPGTVPLETVGSPAGEYFARAFSRSGAKDGRPDARAWLAALEGLKASLRVCPADARHQYSGHLAACPWCAVERKSGVRLFGQRLTPAPVTGMVDISALWNAIAAVPPPPAPPPLPSERPWTPPAQARSRAAALEAARRGLSAGLIVLGLFLLAGLRTMAAVWLMTALFAAAAAVWPWRTGGTRAAARRACAAAEAEWKAALRRWREEATAARFEAQRAALERARAEALDFAGERQRRLVGLEGERELRQKLRYLDRFRLEGESIRGIGAGRAAMLAAYGVETAADVTEERITEIPGFGPALAAQLVAWRGRHEVNFRFNPAQPIDPRDVAALEQELAQRRQEVLETLRNGPDALQKVSREILAARKVLLPELERAWEQLKLAQARVDGL